MAKDFDIQRNNIQVEQVTGNTVYASFDPAVDSNIAVVYIEASSNGAAIVQKLQEIQALADNFSKKVWTAKALANRNPHVTVRVVVQDDKE